MPTPATMTKPAMSAAIAPSATATEVTTNTSVVKITNP
jgi:hypothetical protein